MGKIPLLAILVMFAQNGRLLSQPGATSPLRLEMGGAIERKLSGGQTHRYEISAGEGQYARVAVEQRGIDVVVRLRGAGEKDGLEFDSELRLKGQENAEFVAETAGVYALEVEGKYKAFPPGNYTITILDQRPATERDRVLNHARRVSTEALRLQTAGKYAEARRLAEQAAEIRERESGENDRETALAWQNLGSICYDQQDYDRSQQLAERALRIRETLLGPEHPDVAASLSYLGNTWFRKEDYQRGGALLERALAIYQKALGPEHPMVASVLINLGGNYRRRGDLKKAEEVYRRAMAIQELAVGPEHRNVAILANNLGTVYQDKEDYAAAELAYGRAIALLEKTLGPEHPSLGTPRMNLANTYTHLGDYARAELLYERVLKMFESTLGPNQASTAMLLNNYATCLRLKGDPIKAEGLYRRAIEIREAALGPDHPSVARVLNSLAMNSEIRGDLPQALAAGQRAVRITEREIALNLAIGSERQKLAYLTLLPEENNEIFSLSLGSAAHIPEARELGATILLQRKGRVQDALADSRAALTRRFDPEGRRLFDAWKDTTAKLAGLVLNGPRRGDLVEHKKSINALEDSREKVEEALSRHSAGLFESSRLVALASIRSAIPKGAALIEFAVYRPLNPTARLHDQEFSPPRYGAFVLRREGAVIGKDLGDARRIGEAVAAFREALRDPKRRDVDELARAVDQSVIQPLRASLGDTPQLLISPDGVLNLLPFAALQDPEGRYLVERHTVTYLTSGRDLLRPRGAGQGLSVSPPLIIADPLFDEPASSGRTALPAPQKSARFNNKPRSITTAGDLSGVYFAPLTGASQEAKAIHMLFPDSTVLTGKQATKASLKRAAAPGILHIATHGFFLDDGTSDASAADRHSEKTGVRIENPLLRSGLALAGANMRSGDGRDGILTALEASGLNLWGTKLVTLSACDTGLGEVKNGEGVYGFRRAFVLAGAESLVMSLWPVSDQVTRELMTAYYTGLEQGQGRGEALRQVQLKMKQRKGRQHPFYWASFIQSGEWANLDGRR